VYLYPFTYCAPTTVDEALGLLQAHPDGKILAGGQSLIPLMGLGLARPSALIDVNNLCGLEGVVEDGGSLRIGALVRHRTLATDPAVRRHCPILAEAASVIGNIRVRHRGTIGGSLAHADPAAELPLVATAMGATLEIRGPDASREIAADKFFLGYLQTDLAPVEMVTGIRVPVVKAGTGCGLAELVRRAGDFAIVAACAVVSLDAAGRCTRAALALGGVGSHPVRIHSAEALLVGRALTDRHIGDAADLVPGELDPESDVHASAAYRRAMARVMARRALAAAAGRAAARPQ
jgi:aerobic carbon-monoxide dehydrogenase medium subunit